MVSYQERRSLVNLISGIVITILYSAYMIQRYPQADAYSPDVFQFWGAFFLILIAIVNEITHQEQEPDITDERDRLIEMKSLRNGGSVFILGFVLAMVFVAAGQPPAAMFIALLCAGLVSEMASTISEFFYYRRGV
jgi:hypothetical protein